ncbi:MAG: SEC-C metal-binding domain-containing protein [Acidobacteriota bacterium]
MNTEELDEQSGCQTGCCGPAAAQPTRRTERPGRNDLCWCGSGNKYKKCCMRADQASACITSVA